jgi:hypothetical protein
MIGEVRRIGAKTHCPTCGRKMGFDIDTPTRGICGCAMAPLFRFWPEIDLARKGEIWIRRSLPKFPYIMNSPVVLFLPNRQPILPDALPAHTPYYYYLAITMPGSSSNGSIILFQYGDNPLGHQYLDQDRKLAFTLYAHVFIYFYLCV